MNRWKFQFDIFFWFRHISKHWSCRLYWLIWIRKARSSCCIHRLTISPVSNTWVFPSSDRMQHRFWGVLYINPFGINVNRTKHFCCSKNFLWPKFWSYGTLPSTALMSTKLILKCCVITGGNIVRINLNIRCLNLSRPLEFAETPVIIPSGDRPNHSAPKFNFVWLFIFRNCTSRSSV